MTLISAHIPDGLLKELRQVWEALEERLDHTDFRGPEDASLHRGIPYLGELPPGQVNLWLNLLTVQRSDESSTFIADGYVSTWQVFCIVRDDSEEKYGVDPFKGMEVMAHVERTLAENLSDVDLGGTADVQEVGQIQHTQERLEGGDRLDLWLLTTEVLHSLVNCKS